MCIVKKPKPVVVQRPAEKELAVLRNPFLDGLSQTVRARQTGVRSLRIERGVSPASAGVLSVQRPAGQPVGAVV